jgi:molybdopterin converting factor small subunit
MAIIVRFPAMLHARAGREITVDGPAATIGALVTVLDRRVPGLSAELSDPMFNVAVNDEMLLHDVDAHPLRDGDVVEFVPAIAGG